MESRNFSDILKDAVNGDDESVVAILAQYMPLINRHSKVKGKIDEDLRQYIILRILKSLANFDPNPL